MADEGATAPEKLIPLATLAKTYRRIRGRMGEVQKEYDTQLELLKEQLEAIKLAIKDQLLAQEANSVRTAEGTVILSIKRRYSTSDWDAMKRFIIERDAVDLLERRIHQTNMAQFLDENPGSLPPGLNVFQEYDVSVRKPDSK